MSWAQREYVFRQLDRFSCFVSLDNISLELEKKFVLSVKASQVDLSEDVKTSRLVNGKFRREYDVEGHKKKTKEKRNPVRESLIRISRSRKSYILKGWCQPVLTTALPSQRMDLEFLRDSLVGTRTPYAMEERTVKGLLVQQQYSEEIEIPKRDSYLLCQRWESNGLRQLHPQELQQ